MTERALDRRVAELESRCRRLQLLTFSVVCIVAVAGLSGWAGLRPSAPGPEAAETTRTQQVVLVDSAGRRTADLSADASGVEIRLYRSDVELEPMAGGRDAPGDVVDARARITHAPSLLLTDGAGNVMERLGRR